MNRCLYCGTSLELTESHIIPEALGNKGPTLKNAVCKKCNEAISRDVEVKIIKELSFIRNILCISGKRNKRPKYKILSSFDGKEEPIYIKDPEDLNSEVIISAKDKGKISIFGNAKQVEKHQESYKKRHPNVKWEDKTDEYKKNTKFNLFFDHNIFCTDKALRLSCKIAFEWLYKTTDNKDCFYDSKYDHVRKYILKGVSKNQNPIVCIAFHPNIQKGVKDMPFGKHYIINSYSINSDCVIAIVGLFGLVPYKVVLPNPCSILINRLILTMINPQTGKLYEPILRNQIGEAALYHNSKFDNRDQTEVINMLKKQMQDKIRNALVSCETIK